MPGIGRFAALLYVLTAALVAADPVLTDDSNEPVAVADRQEEEASQFGAVIPVTYRQLPAGTGYKRVTVGVGESDSDGAVAGVEETLIYSNTLGRFIFPVFAGFLVADDIATIAPDGCELTRFSFQVMGNADLLEGENRPYTVTYALWDTCPEAVPADASPSRIIAGTFGTRTVDTADPDGPANIGDVVEIEVDLTELDVSGNTSMWLAIMFDRDNAAIIGGAPAVEGFSGDFISFPALGCSPNFGGFPAAPHASFNVEVFGESASCPCRHLSYRNTREEGIPFNVGTDQVVVDDLMLLAGSGDCLLTGYEVAVLGRAVYHMELRNGCAGDPPDQEWFPNGTSAAIDGTYKRWSIGVLSSGTRIIRIPVDPPVLISGTVFLAVKVTNPFGGPILTGTQATVGSTGSVLQQMAEDGSCFSARLPTPISHGALQATLVCDGCPDSGACCDSSPGLGGVCTNALREECVGKLQSFFKLSDCADVECIETTGACCDGLTGVCFESLQRECIDGTHLMWTANALCSEISCDAALGACCDTGTNDPTVATCTSTTQAGCNCQKCGWVKGTACESIECNSNFQTIPTASGWSLVFLALILLSGGKIFFSRREGALA